MNHGNYNERCVMPFKNSRQRAQVCKVFLDMEGMGKYCDFEDVDLAPFGLNQEAVVELCRIREEETRLSPGEQVLLTFVWDIWNDSGQTPIGKILGNLDSGVVQSIGELLQAVSQDDQDLITEWIEKWKGYNPSSEFFAG